MSSEEILDAPEKKKKDKQSPLLPAIAVAGIITGFIFRFMDWPGSSLLIVSFSGVFTGAMLVIIPQGFKMKPVHILIVFVLAGWAAYLFLFIKYDLFAFAIYAFCSLLTFTIRISQKRQTSD